MPGHPHLAEWIRLRGQRHRRRRLGARDLRQQFLLPVQPSTCQVPRPNSTASIASVMTPGHSSRRSPVTAPSRWRDGGTAAPPAPPSPGASSAIASGIVTTGHSTACSQSGGEKRNSTQNASATTIAPSSRMTPTTAPSPASCARRSRPQTSQRVAHFQQIAEQTALAAARAATGQRDVQQRRRRLRHPASVRRRRPGWRPTSRCR